jgi:hypothetical protein
VLGPAGDVALALAERGEVDLERVDPEEEVLAELLGLDHLAEVAVGRAEDADVDPERVVLADAADLARLQEPEQLDLTLLSSSPTSSRKSVPPLATSKSPLRLVSAPVNEPLAVAEELALDEVLGQGAAVDRDEGVARPRLLSWRLRAISSLPVPVSPRIMTLASVGAMVSIRRRTASIDGVSPMSVGVPSAAFSRVSSAVALFERSRRSATRLRMTSSSAHLQGLVR